MEIKTQNFVQPKNEIIQKYITYPDSFSPDYKIENNGQIKFYPEQQPNIPQNVEDIIYADENRFKQRVSFSDRSKIDQVQFYYTKQIHIYKYQFNIQQNSLQIIPLKIYFTVVFLLILGTVFLIWGFLDLFSLSQESAGLALTIIGGLMLFSGLYYVRKIIAFRSAITPEDRERVLQDFPQQ